MRIISIVNQKGGCGKTTTAVNLAAVLAAKGRRVLLVDLDPQSHCAAALGVPEDEIEYSTIDLLLDPPSGQFNASQIGSRTWEVAYGLRLLPSTVRLARAEAPGGGLMEAGDRDRRLKRGLEAFSDSMDYCLIDCPPTIGLLTFNALRAADEVVVPVETGFLATRGAQRQWATLRAMAARIGRPVRARIVPNLLHDERSLDRELLEALRSHFGAGVSPHPIRDHLDIREATAFGRAVIEHAPESEATRDYQSLAAWLETESAAVIEPPVQDEAEVSSPSPGVTAPAGTIRSEPPASRLGDESGIRDVEVSSRVAELVQRLRPRRSSSAGVTDRVSGPEPVSGRIRIVQPAALGDRIAVTGDFNQWHEAGLLLRSLADQAEGPQWVGIEVPGESEVRYRLVVDGKSMLDPSNPRVVDGPDGLPASVIGATTGKEAARATTGVTIEVGALDRDAVKAI
ncbi:MAG: AAA family ATPase [Planctomycetota bacterium]|nr:AAA family ATPase [Planctomycetota bacterium]